MRKVDSIYIAQIKSLLKQSIFGAGSKMGTPEKCPTFKGLPDQGDSISTDQELDEDCSQGAGAASASSTAGSLASCTE